MSLVIPTSQVQTGRQPTDLWQQALLTLDNDLRASLDFKTSTKRNIVEKTLRLAEEKRQICLKKRWKFKLNGKEVVIRDVLEKIIRWLDHFIAIGDIAVQYDPVHASLPWAGVRFLLMVAVSDTHVFASTVVVLETVSHLITRYAIFEDVHLKRNTAAAAELEPNLISLYAELLIILAKAKKYLQTSTAVRMMKSVVAAFEIDEEQQMQNITTQEKKISALAALSDADLLNRLKGFEQPILRLVDQAATYEKQLEDNRYREILDWLSPINFVMHQTWQSERRLPTSGEWLLNHREYLDWQSSSVSSIFLLHGMTGSGKTSLASAVVDSLTKSVHSQQTLAPLASSYCSKNASEIERSDPCEIVRSILRQLGGRGNVRKNIHDTIVSEYECRNSGAKDTGFDIPRLSMQDCVRLLLNIIASDPATIVIDAIDELQPNKRHELINVLKKLVKDSENVVKIFLTSRDNDQISALLTEFPHLRISAEDNREDMEMFIDHHISLAIQSRRLLGGVVNSSLKEDLSRALVESAGEIFQLVIWQINKLCDLRHSADIEKAMRRFSENSLDQLYSEFLVKIRAAKTYCRRITILAFSLLLCLHEPLSPTAFLVAVSQVQEKDQTALELPELLRICYNLIILDPKLNVIRFAHTSVQEFLESQPEFAPVKTNELVATSCLKSLLYGSSKGLQDGLCPSDQFNHYSTLYWAKHCKFAFMTDDDSDLLGLVNGFIFDDDNEVSLVFIQWLEDVQEYCKLLPRHHLLKRELSAVISQSRTPLFTFCVFGFATLFRQLSQGPDFDWNEKNDLGQSGLYLACSLGLYNIVQVFLSHDLDIDASGGRYGNSLQAACFEGHIKVAHLLMENGVNPRSSGKFVSALQASIVGDQEEIALLLLQKCFRIAEESEYERTLQEASQIGHIKVIQYLQDLKTPSFGDSDSARCKAIRAAIYKGHMGVVERLIRKSQDAKNDMLIDSVAIAASGGHNKLVTLLLDEGLEIDQEGQFGSPLRAASLFGHELTVRLLLDRCAKVSANSPLGNALEAAAMNDHVSVARVLLAEGIDVNIRGGRYGTALQSAAWRGHLKMAELLLDCGADIYMEGFAKDAFHTAVEGGHEDVVLLFLDRGFEIISPLSTAVHLSGRVDTRDRYWTLMRESSPSRKPDSLVCVDARSPTYGESNSPLISAATSGHLQMLQLILDGKSHIEAKMTREVFRTALERASQNGHEDVANFLVNRFDGDVRAHLSRALSSAASNGHLRVVDMLSLYLRQHQSTDEDSTKKVAKDCVQIKEDILLPGCRGNHIAVVSRALDSIDEQCPLAAQTSIFRTEALHESARHNSGEVIDFLFTNSEFDNTGLLEAIRISSHFGSDASLCGLIEKLPQDEFLIRILNCALIGAAFNGRPEVIMTLVHMGADPNVYFESPLQSLEKDLVERRPENMQWPSQRKQYTTPQTALQAAFGGFDSSAEFDHRYVCKWDNAAIVAREATVFQLLELGARAFKGFNGLESLLIAATNYCSAKTVRLIVEKDPSSIEDHSQRILAVQIAAQRGTAEIVEVLLPAQSLLAEDHVSRDLTNLGLKVALDSALSLFPDLINDTEDSLEALLLDLDHEPESLYDETQIGLGAVIKTISPRSQYESVSVFDAMHKGAGAVIKMILRLLPTEKADDDRYGSLLVMATAINDVDCIDLLLHRGVNINARGPYYGTALQCAARLGNLELIGLFLSANADVNIINGHHSTSIRAAVVGGHERAVQLLLEHGADVDLRADDQSTSIVRLALCSSNPIILESIIAASAEKQADVDSGFPLLTQACALGDIKTVNILLKHGISAKLNGKRYEYERWGSKSSMPLVSAIAVHDAKAVRDTLSKVDENVSPLHMACARGHEDIVKTLLEHDSEPYLMDESEEGSEKALTRTPLQMAALGGHHSIVRLLIEAGMKVDHCNALGTALSIVSREGKFEMVRELVDIGATVFDPLERWNALTEACRSRCRSIVDLLLDRIPEDEEQRACSNATSGAIDGQDAGILKTLLQNDAIISPSIFSQACAVGSEDSVLLLLRHGVCVNAEDGEDCCNLQIASYHQRPAIVDLLLENGADVHLLSAKHESPLQAALGADVDSISIKHENSWRTTLALTKVARDIAACKHIVRALLNKGANVNTTLPHLGGCLHLASFIGSVEIIEMLLEHGADMTSNCERFDNALIAATEAGRTNVVEFLLSQDFDVNRISAKHGSALHYACHIKHEAIVRTFLRYGAVADAAHDPYGTLLAAAMSCSRDFDFEQAEDVEIVEIILRSGKYGEIQEVDLLLATTPYLNQDLVQIFFEHDQNLRVTERVLIAAVEKVRHHEIETLRLLLLRDDGVGITANVLKAARHPAVLNVLLSHRPICRITPEIFRNIAVPNVRKKPSPCQYEMGQLLLNHGRNIDLSSFYTSYIVTCAAFYATAFLVATSTGQDREKW